MKDCWESLFVGSPCIISSICVNYIAISYFFKHYALTIDLLNEFGAGVNSELLCDFALDTLPLGGVQSIVMSMYVCLSVHSHNSETTVPNFMLPVVVARSSSGRTAICYVFLVLWMTSCLRIMGPMARDEMMTTAKATAASVPNKFRLMIKTSK